jgi:hypothetical protein
MLASSCAHGPRPEPAGVNIERRPSPPQPDTTRASATPTGRRTVVMTSQTLRGALASIAADTTAARNALDRCSGRNLQPDQDGVRESTTRLLMEVHQALAVVDFARAKSLARQAHQLSASLGCR